MHCLAKVIVKLDMITGWKSSILGYMSKGDNVPDVMTTDWNLSNTGLIAILASRQDRLRIGLTILTVPATFSSLGSMMMVNPLV